MKLHGSGGTSWDLYGASESMASLVVLLHLVKHVREGLLHFQGLLDLDRGDIRVLPIFEEARALVLAEKRNEGRDVRFPVYWKALELLEDRVDARLREESD